MTWSYAVVEAEHEIQNPTFRVLGAEYRDRYLRWQRASPGWAILVCRA